MTVTLLCLAESERHALAGLVQLRAVRVGDAITHARDADELEDAIEGAREHLALMRACEHGHLTVDRSMTERLQDRRHQLLAMIASLRAAPASPAPGLTSQQRAEKTRAEIDRLADEAEAIESVLRRGAPERGAA
jgi:hypothetical protein